AARASAELAELGVENQHLVVNGVFTASSDDPFAIALQERGAKALAQIPPGLSKLPQSQIPLLAKSVTGLQALRQLLAVTAQDGLSANMDMDLSDSSERAMPTLDSLIDELTAAGHGVILTMGKGGVGKTSIAAALALAIAERGHDVHLSTTDPAAHLVTTLGDDIPANMTVSRIDPVAETAKYSAEVLARAG